MGAVYDILVDGTGKAREVAANTLAEVKQAMKLNYFDDKALILKQVNKVYKSFIISSIVLLTTLANLTAFTRERLCFAHSTLLM